MSYETLVEVLMFVAAISAAVMFGIYETPRRPRD
jgi:hypothetical protein